MLDEDKSKEQLIQELRILRQEIAVLSRDKEKEGFLDGEEGFRVLVEHSYELISVIDSEGRLLYLSPNHSEIVGFNPSERVGRTIFENVHPEDLAVLREVFNRSRDRKHGNIVCRYKSKNGDWRWLEARGRFYVNRQGEERGVIISRDVTEHKRTEEALREQRLLLDNILNSIPVPVFYKDTRERFMGCNSAFLDFLGLPRQRILGNTVAGIHPAGLAEIYHKADEGLLRTGGTQVYESVIPFADGSLHEVIFHKAVFKNVAGEISGLVGVMIDITDRKRAEEALRKHREHLEELVKERTGKIVELESQRAEIEKKVATGLMAAQIAHEINNPLSGIKNSFLLIKDAVSEDHPYHEYVARIEKEINRIARIIHQMFDLYHLDEEIRNEFPIDKTIHDVVALLEAAWREKSLDIKVDSESAVLEMPEGSLRQILYNILTNAIDASPKSGMINIVTEVKNHDLILSIFDQGPGIPIEVQPHIFEPFFSTKRGYKNGLGLGLSISKEIIEKLGGRISFESERGNGSAFKIFLPTKSGGGKESDCG